MKNIIPHAGTAELTALWHKAKEAELAWQAHRRELEARIVELNKDQIEEVKEALAADRVLSRSVGLDGLVLKVARDLEIDQAQAALFATQYPQLMTIVLKSEFKPVARGVLGALAKPETQLGQEVAEMVSFKESRVSFSKP
jgi:hypothetical protein